MISIKSSFANCSACELLEFPSCILETNCEKDLSKVDVIFIAENPGKDEVKKGQPLIGKSGKTFRKYFEKFKLNKLNYLLTNVVLCQTILKDGTTGNPSKETINLCKENCFNIIEQCNPKLIVLMGASPMNAFKAGYFEMGNVGVTKKRGNFFKWSYKNKIYNIFVTVHPSFVNRDRSYEPIFESDLAQVAKSLTGNKTTKTISSNKTSGKKGIYYYKIPEKFYTNKYRLVDIQFLNKKREVLYIFRDVNNKKIYHKENDNYVAYFAPKKISPKKIVSYKELEQASVPYRDKIKLDPERTYEGDLKITTKHAIDYYIKNKEEAPIKDLNILYHDIELYSTKKGFPHPDKAEAAICLISYNYHKKCITYVIDPKSLLGKKNKNTIEIDKLNGEVIICQTEKELVNNFIKDLKKLNPDIVTGWHSNGFDLPYIYNRCKKIGISQNSISPFNECYFNSMYGICDIYGFTILDQLILYKTYTFTKKENYKLGTIGKLELNKEKLDSGKDFNELYETNINQYIRYNRRDVELLVDLENKLKHISLQNEVKIISKNCFKGSSSPMGMLDSLIVAYMKEKGLSSKNADIHSKGKKFEGAYVKEPRRGVHKYIVDFDFTSLYPSNILTYNIGLNSFVMKFKDTSLGYEFTYDIDKLPNEFEIILDPSFSKEVIKISKEDFIKKVKDQNLISTVSGCFFLPHDKEFSFYGDILKGLLSSRKIYKKKMFDCKISKNKDLETMYNTRQMSYKIFANTIYGILGNNVFRFFDIDLARTITLCGQEAIKKSIIYGNNFTEELKTRKKKEIIPLSKSEMYGDLTRDTKYVITGDTDSLFITLDDLLDKNKSDIEIIEDIHKYCDQIQNYLNKDIVQKIVEKHNVPLDRNRLDLKNELIIKTGLFLQKKQYAIWVIENEGQKMDKIISMGISTKRSDFSTLTKEYLNELLEIILKSQIFSINKVNEFVERKGKEISKAINSGKKEIGKPAGWGKNLKEYKKIPQNVIACQNFNLLEYEAFTTGDRGYLFKILGVDYDKAPSKVIMNYEKEFITKGKKLEVICIPDSELKLPNYYISDMKAMMRFHWSDRVNQFLEPLISIPTKILEF